MNVPTCMDLRFQDASLAIFFIDVSKPV
jgi:hypothetical protein